SDNAKLNMSSSVIKNYTTALHIGISSDTSSTEYFGSGLDVRNCTTDILQEGSAKINLDSSKISGNKITVNDATNVSLAYFDLDDNNALTIGSTDNIDTQLLHVATGNFNEPGIEYLSSFYSTQAIGYNNKLSNPASLFMLSQDNA